MTESPVTHHLRPDLSIDQQLALKTAATRLAREFDGTFGVETIERFLHCPTTNSRAAQPFPTSCPCWPSVSPANASTPWPRVEGKSRDGRPTVLFLCTHNAGRSQMALGFFTHLAGDNVSPGPAAQNPDTKSTPQP